MTEIRRELPGDVLRELRAARGYRGRRTSDEEFRYGTRRTSPRLVGAFAEMTSWSYSKLNRLERIRWETDPTTWRSLFSIADLEDLVEAGWLEGDDDYYCRFESAIEWQAKVYFQGTSVYEGAEVTLERFAAITAEHVGAVVHAHVEQTSTDGKIAIHLPPETLGALEDRVRESTLFMLIALHLARPAGEDDEEVTRSLLQMSRPDAPDTPYIRTLQLAYGIAKIMLQSEIDSLRALQEDSDSS